MNETRQDVVKTVMHPDAIDYSRAPLKIAQHGFDKTRVLRVVYKEVAEAKIIITFYPGRRNQYDKK